MRTTPDPERGWALAALTGALSFQHAKAGMIRALIAERTDPVLFELSYDYVGDLSETVALMWPAAGAQSARTSPPSPRWSKRSPRSARRSCRRSSRAGSTGSTKPGRWALLKLVTGGLRIGVSARLAKTAAASLGNKEPDEIEVLWHGLAPPYRRAVRLARRPRRQAVSRDPAPFRPAMLAHAIEETDLAELDPADFMAEWKWDGIRVQAVAGADEDGTSVARLYSRTGEDISGSFPDLLEALRLPGAIDGELLIMRERRVQSFNVLQQRLNRKAVTPKLLTEFPAHLRAYDLLADGDEDLRALPFAERRARLEKFVAALERSAHRSVAAGAVRHLGANWRPPAAIRHRPARARTPMPSKA